MQKLKDEQTHLQQHVQQLNSEKNNLQQQLQQLNSARTQSQQQVEQLQQELASTKELLHSASRLTDFFKAEAETLRQRQQRQ